MMYDLKDDELKTLTSNSIKKEPIDKRLEVLSNVIGGDFQDKITMDMLNSKERINIDLKPEVRQQLEVQEQRSEEESVQSDQNQAPNVQSLTPELHLQGDAVVDGKDLDMLNDNKGWYREGKYGREVSVDEISVAKDATEGTYKMTAIINGQAVTHDISQKQYDKFMAVDDYHRMKLFSKIFGEVNMKDRTSLGTKIGAALLAGLGVAAEVGSELHRPHGAPVVVDHHHGAAPPRPYFKPGVDTPMDVAARNFEAAMNQEVLHPHMGKGL